MDTTNLYLSVDQKTALRSLTESEASNLFDLVESNRSYLREFLGWLDLNTSEEDFLVFIKGEIDKQKRQEGYTLGVYDSEKLVGLISLYAIDHLNHNVSIGYWLSEKSQGKGIMTRSVETLMQFAFAKLKMHRIEIRCAVHNQRSLKIPQKLGFTKEVIVPRVFMQAKPA